MHYKTSSSTYSVLPVSGEGADKPLYLEKVNQCLINEFGIFVQDELYTFQNMSMLKMPDKAKLDKLMESRYPGIGTDDDKVVLGEISKPVPKRKFFKTFARILRCTARAGVISFFSFPELILDNSYLGGF